VRAGKSKQLRNIGKVVLEIAVSGGSAAVELGVTPGTTVILTPSVQQLPVQH